MVTAFAQSISGLGYVSGGVGQLGPNQHGPLKTWPKAKTTRPKVQNLPQDNRTTQLNVEICSDNAIPNSLAVGLTL